MPLRSISQILLILVACSPFSPPTAVRTLDSAIGLKEFGQLLTSLSEPEGYFDSDNFVSNEAAYLRVLPALRRLGVRGGVYIGVGPDQNYSYIADVHPRLAIIIDIRRQNALQHLYYKALFELSPNRVAYLERLFGRAIAHDVSDPQNARIGDLLHRVDRATYDETFATRKKQEAIRLLQSWIIGLTNEDLRAIDYIAQAFMEGGPDLKFTSYHRSPRPHHPSYRALLEEKDPSGQQTNYLAQEERFRVIKKLHHENRILPLVGDFGGAHAFQAVARELRLRGLEVKCMYASNVEFYLFRSERWPPYVGNVRSLPLAREAFIIRAYANMWQPHPAQMPGYYMTTVMHSIQTFLANETAGKNETYWDVVAREYIIQ
jgi:hypothetical protein